MLSNLQTFYINSKKRENGTNSNFSYNFDIHEPISHVSLVYITIPKSYYMIQNNYNTFILIEGAQEIIITIPEGNYTREQLYVQLKIIMDAASLNAVSYTISNNQTLYEDGKLKIITNDAIINKKLMFLDTNPINEVFGFCKGYTDIFTTQIISCNVINLSRENTIYLMSDCISTIQQDQIYGGNQILDVIYSSQNKLFSYITQQYDIFENMKPFNNKSYSTFNFQLINEDGIPLELNGVDWSFTLCFFLYIENKNIYKKISNYIDYNLINNKN